MTALGRTFDVVVVGAGPAGCVLASRLSEDASRQVLLIEAGSDAAPSTEHPDVLDPFGLMSYNNPAFRWPGLQAELGADPGNGGERFKAAYVQAYGVGGGSNINGMAADRGQPGDYDEWCRLGAEGWSWEEVLPYFRKMEHDLDFANSPASHGNSGPMPVRRLPRSRWAPFAAATAEALHRRGLPLLDDYMADFREGFGAAPTNCLPERRMSASMAYLTREVRRRANLTILAEARVERLLFAGRRIEGAVVHVKGTSIVVHGREVILCCGAIWSPVLLLRSGVGPRSALERHGIEVIRDLPGVGANLQNHPTVSFTTFLRPQAIQPADNPWFLQNWARYSSDHPRSEPYDMHLMAFNRCDWHVLGRRVGQVAVTVLKAYSRGHVELTSADPASQPSIRFNLLEDPRDDERLVAGTRFALELLTDPVVANLRHELFTPNAALAARMSRRTGRNAVLASAIVRAFDFAPVRRILLSKARIDPQPLLADERALRDYVRRTAAPQFHVCGTCRMGRSDDVDAVVDSQGRVLGIEGLRVADASIFPTIPRGYTHFPVIMTAEKIADAVRHGKCEPRCR